MTAMTDSQSALMATTTSGAMARIGTVCDATTYGTSARSASREWTKKTPEAEAQQAAEDEPANASREGEWPPGRRGRPPAVARRAGPDRRRPRAMSQTCGSDRSSAIRQRERRDVLVVDLQPDDAWRGSATDRRPATWRPPTGRQGDEDEDQADDRCRRERARRGGTPRSAADARRRDPLAVVMVALDGSSPGAQATAASAMSSARSMIAKPSASCSSVMHSGGLVWIELLAIIVYRPFSRRYLPDRLHLVATCR